jgi:4-hydroxythreonine-4-phosphate dehydrogenase
MPPVICISHRDAAVRTPGDDADAPSCASFNDDASGDRRDRHRAVSSTSIRRGHETLLSAGIPRPRIAVCGINPHAGEGGLFGRGEEAEKIVPAVAAVRAAGIDASGPLAADTTFFRAVRGDFDLVVAMYHDQGHGPVKVLGLDAGVNITIGLPVVRTSVDHGTAFDIAGTGEADERSLLEALRQAAELGGRS